MATVHSTRSFYNAKLKSLKDTNVKRWWKEVKNITAGIAEDEGD